MNHDPLSGEALPEVTGAVPGPRSRELGRRLSAVESPNITSSVGAGPIFWAEARGANVRDADGNVYVDLTGGFGVAAAGHADPVVASAIAAQAARLPHGLGDVYPAEQKVALLERLAQIAPGDLSVSILGSAGAEAVEAALKTAVLRTGRTGILAFRGGYHGLTYGALSTTWRDDFRAPFRDQLLPVRFAPYPDAYRWPEPGLPHEQLADRAIAAARSELEAAESGGRAIGAILVEPIQGRGGIIVPPPGFLSGLRRLADDHGAVLIFDEIYSGCGRTGRWFACEHERVVPDVLTIGKAMSGSLPLSAAIGTPEVMAAWPPSAGEAIHTSTFLGNPISCAAAVAHLSRIEEMGLLQRAEALGERIAARCAVWSERFDAVGDHRGRGLFRGVELVEDRHSRKAAADLAHRVVGAALQRGVLLLSEGPAANILAFTPPLVITETQLDHALDVVEDAIAAAVTSR